jgi:hypothetical protein
MMAQISVEVCDVCLDRTREVTNWKICLGQEARKIALCSEHASPLVEMMGIGVRVSLSEARKASGGTPAKVAPPKGRTGARKAAKRPAVKLTAAQARKLAEVSGEVYEAGV